jgi:hypothetical protein
MSQSTTDPITTLPTISKMISINELINNSIVIYKTFILKLLGLRLIFVLLSLPAAVIIGYALFFYLFIREPMCLIVAIISAILIIILWTMSQIGQLIILKEMPIKKGIVQYIKESWPLFGNYFYISFLFFLIVLLGSIALVIPGIYFGTMYFLAMLVFIFEGKTGILALKRSKELVKNYWWSVFGRLVAISALFFIIRFALSIPTKFMEAYGLVYMLWSFFTYIVILIISPLMLIYVYFIYKDLVRIKGVN